MNICYVVAMLWSSCSFFKKRNWLKICLLLLQSFTVIVLFNVCYTSQKWMLNRMGLSPAREDENQTVFLKSYSKYCEEFLLPNPVNVRAMGKIANESESRLCPCIPDTLGKCFVPICMQHFVSKINMAVISNFYVLQNSGVFKGGGFGG